MDDQDTIVIEETQGAAPLQGLSLGDIIKYGPVVQKVIDLILKGEGGFDVKVGPIRKHIEVTDLP